MNSYAVAEKFVSINGEGKHAGELAVFLRFRGCNLACGFCDTKWANTAAAPAVRMTTDELVAYVRETGVRNVTLTGGEPLLQPGIDELLRRWVRWAIGWRSRRTAAFRSSLLRPCRSVRALPWIISCRGAAWNRPCCRRIFPCCAAGMP